MPIEPNVQYIDDLVPANPPATDPLSQVDDHLKLIKLAVQQSFPGITGAMTATHTVLNGLDGRVTALEGIVAIENNSGTPVLGTGITTAEIRNLIGVGSVQAVSFGNLSTPQVAIGAWKITESGGSLYFKYGNSSVNKVRIDSNGDIRTVGDVIAAASI